MTMITNSQVNHFLSLNIKNGHVSDPGLPLAEILVLCGFFMIYLVEELVHHFMHKDSNKDKKDGGGKSQVNHGYKKEDGEEGGREGASKPAHLAVEDLGEEGFVLELLSTQPNFQVGLREKLNIFIFIFIGNSLNFLYSYILRFEKFGAL